MILLVNFLDQQSLLTFPLSRSDTAGKAICSYVMRRAGSTRVTPAVRSPDHRNCPWRFRSADRFIVQKQGWGVTISHTDSLAFALAFPTGHPIGIDAERIDSTCFETIFSQLSEREIEWIEAAKVERKPALATALWTGQEALLKIVGTLLTSPIQIYGLVEFNLICLET